jgi:PKD repeat protein
VGDVNEPVLVFKSDDPVAGVDVENGSTVSLDPLHVGCTAAHLNCHPFRETSLFVRNDGNEPLEVSHLSFEGPTEWSLDAPATDPFTIPAGGVEEVRVRVDALEVGATASRLELSTNDPDLPKYVVHFAAEVTSAPVADFIHYCDRLSCSFDGGSSTGVGLNDFGFVWLLDGGSSTFGPTRSHTFLTSGVHTVELRVTDATGAQHRLQRTVSVAPEAGFIHSCSHATRSCDFDGAAATDGVVSYRYAFGDGTVQEGLGHPGEVLLRHTYATSGRYDVSLTGTDGDGQEDTVTHEVTLVPVPDFVASCSSDTLTCEFDASLASPQMVLYEWSFGDGTLGTGLQTAHTYATSGVYTVTLTVVDPSGQVEAIFKPVAVLPRAEFSLICDPETRSCDFDGSASTPGVTHEWDFGDDSPPATGPMQEHTYATSGIFTVTLTVTDGSGQTDTASRPVVIPPHAAFKAFCDGLVCSFDATGSSPGVVSYAWDLGHDGATGTGVAPTHVFPDESDYDVTLTITDASGQVATTTRTVAVFDEELFLLLLLDRH